MKATMPLWLKILGLAIAAAIFGAALGFMLLSEVSFFLTWLAFPAALNSGSYLRSMDGTGATGVLLGTVTGLAVCSDIMSRSRLQMGSADSTPVSHVSSDVTPVPRAITYLRKIAGGLCIWIGLTTTLPFLLGGLIVLALTLSGKAELPNASGMHIGAFTACLVLPTMLWGIGLLWWSLGQLLPRPLGVWWCKLGREVREGFKAVFRVGPSVAAPGSGVEHITLHSHLSPKACRETLERECDVERGLLSRALLHSPLAEGKRFIIGFLPRRHDNGNESFSIRISRRADTSWYQFSGHFTPLTRATGSTADGTLTEGTHIEVTPTVQILIKIFFLYWFGMLALMTIMLLFASLADAITLVRGGLPDKQNSFAGLLFMGSFWLVGIAFLRFGRWLAGRFQNALVPFLENALDATVVERRPEVRRFVLF